MYDETFLSIVTMLFNKKMDSKWYKCTKTLFHQILYSRIIDSSKFYFCWYTIRGIAWTGAIDATDTSLGASPINATILRIGTVLVERELVHNEHGMSYIGLDEANILIA